VQRTPLPSVLTARRLAVQGLRSGRQRCRSSQGAGSQDGQHQVKGKELWSSHCVCLLLRLLVPRHAVQAVGWLEGVPAVALLGGNGWGFNAAALARRNSQ
jgi:hypothetical protein